MSLDILHEKRLFQPVRATVRKSIGSFESNVQGVSLVGVGHDDEVSPQLLTHGPNDSNILIEMEPDFDFHAVKSLLGKSARALGHFRWLLRIESRCVNRNFLAHFSTQEIIEWHASYLAENIP
jgi:hypothetical protein